MTTDQSDGEDGEVLAKVAAKLGEITENLDLSWAVTANAREHLVRLLMQHDRFEEAIRQLRTWAAESPSEPARVPAATILAELLEEHLSHKAAAGTLQQLSVYS